MSSTALKVLMVEDSEDDVLLLRRQLEDAGYRVDIERADTRETLAHALDRQRWDIVFSDFSMPLFDGMQALKVVREHDPDVPFIIVSGTIGEERAVQLMKSGAQDYVLKSNVRRLVPAIERELRDAELRRAHRQAQEHIQHLAYYDPLTGLSNRTRFLEQLTRHVEVQRAADGTMTVMAMELTYYDEINMTLGYSVGDALLVQAAERLQRALPTAEVVAVLGTARFAAILSAANASQAQTIAERIQREFGQPFDIAGFRLSSGLCVGVTEYPAHGIEPQLLLRRAEMALVLGRRSSSGYALYSLERDPSNPENLALATDLRDAIDSGSLQLYFQPKIELPTGRVLGVEALPRWQHPKKGMIPPDRFIPLAEKLGLINSLTFWLLGSAAKQYCAWRDLGLDIPIAVNLSVRDLIDDKLLPRLRSLIGDQHLPPGAIEAEITESALMDDPVNSLKTLHALRELGIGIAVDDFGTGYSSLGYLRDLPIDSVKLDRSFILGMAINPNSMPIVRWTIELAHNLGLRAIAEGVEDRVTLDELAALGCDAIQGYFVSRPLPPTEFLNWYKNYTPVPLT